MALNSYEDVLESYIHDDDKLVTYKWLSKELEVHVNTAKDILNQYWKKYKDTKNFNATILLVGRLHDQSIRVEVVKDDNLKLAKSKFSKIDCEHVYSLQKCLDNVELLAFAGEGNFQFSAIKYNNEYIKNAEEPNDLEYSSTIEEQTRKQNIEKDTVTKSTSEKDIFTKPSSEKKITSDKSLTTINKSKLKSDNIKKQGKERNKNNQLNKNHRIEETFKSSTVDNKCDKNKEDIFTKSKSKKEINSEIINSKGDGKKEDMESSKTLQVKKNPTIEETYKKSSIIVNNDFTNLKSTNKNDKGSKKRNRSQDNIPSKRKRIVTQIFSDESENSGNEEKEEEEEEQEVKSNEKANRIEQPRIRKDISQPTSSQNVNSRHIIRKTVDKTFKDEDGYLVTKRVHIHEVDVNNEKSEEIKLEQPSKPKSLETKTKKQSTLFNFFKKT